MALTEAQEQAKIRKAKMKSALQSKKDKSKIKSEKKASPNNRNKLTGSFNIDWTPSAKKVVQDNDPVLAYAKTMVLPGFEFDSARFEFPRGTKTPSIVLVVTVKNKETGKFQKYEMNYKKLERDMKKNG